MTTPFFNWIVMVTTIDWIQKNGIQIAALQETNLNKQSTLKSSPSYCIIQENRPWQRCKSGGVTFIIKDNSVSGIQTQDFWQLPRRPSHATPQVVLTSNYWSPTNHLCLAEMQDTRHRSVNNELDDCIIVGKLNAHSPLCRSKLPGDRTGNNIASE